MAMFAVAMTDGGGGKSKAPAKQSILSTAAAAIKGAATAIATGAKAAISATVTAAEAAKKKAAAEAAAKAQTQARTQTQQRPTAAQNAPAPAAPAASADNIIEWNGVQFYVKPSEIRSFRDLSISASCETEDEENGGEKYAKKKNNGGYEAKLTAIFDQRLGVSDVKQAAINLCDMARTGAKGYLYHKGGKLISGQMMATSATANKWTFAPDGSVISVDVDISWKQGSKNDGGTAPATPTGPGSGGSRPGDTGKTGGGTYTATVYYSASSGAVQSVTATSTVSYADAQKKAYDKVPGNAQWASTTKPQATNQDPRKATATATQQSTLAKAQATIQGAKTTLSATKTGFLSGVASAVTKLVNMVK